MKAYYPITTPKIMHKGRNGNIYRLDEFEKCLQIYKELSNHKEYVVEIIKLPNNKSKLIKLLSYIHSKRLISSYKVGKPKHLVESSGILWQPLLFNYILECTACLIKAVDYSINVKSPTLVISGGGHHCETDKPFGFCTINTMALAAKYALGYTNKVALIDLDTHYSNGCFEIFNNNNDVLCTNLWNQTLNKWSFFEPSKNIWHKKVSNKNDYEKQLKELLNMVYEFNPNFVVYHLGLDVLDTDRMGGITEFDTNYLIEREKKITSLLKSTLKIPYVIFLGGSYVDYSLGVKNAELQRNRLTKLYIKALEVHRKTQEN